MGGPFRTIIEMTIAAPQTHMTAYLLNTAATTTAAQVRSGQPASGMTLATILSARERGSCVEPKNCHAMRVLARGGDGDDEDAVARGR